MEKLPCRSAERCLDDLMTGLEMRLASIDTGRHCVTLNLMHLTKKGAVAVCAPQTRAVVEEVRLWMELLFDAIATSQFSLDRSWNSSQATRLESFSR